MENDAQHIDLIQMLRRAEPFGASRRMLSVLLELQIPMMLGAVVCYLLGPMIAASPTFATAYHAGTGLYAAADALYLSLPVAAWMLARGRGWRRSLEMAASMLAPVAAIGLIGEVAQLDTLRWLITGGYPVMCAGMLLYMLYRRECFTAL